MPVAEAQVEYFLPGQNGGLSGHGPVADRLMAVNMDTGALRPFMDKHGRVWMSLMNEHTGKRQNVPVYNATSALPIDAWKMFDDAVVRETRLQLTVWGDLVSQGLRMNIPNAMGTPILLHQTMTDAGEADLSMDGIRQTKRDQVEFGLEGLPLPIVHSDFDFSLRDLAVSRNPGRGVVMPKDTTMIEQSTRKCMEKIEKLTLGTLASYSYAGFTVYGLTNYPYRMTRVLTLPTAPGWTPETLGNELLDMIQDAHNVQFYGPYGIWYSPGWFRYFNADYSSAQPSAGTLNRRLQEIQNIKFWHQADFLTGYTILLVQLSPWIIQALQGLRLQVLQWDSVGGLVKNWKILGIMVPRVRRNASGNTGIVHAVAA